MRRRPRRPVRSPRSREDRMSGETEHVEGGASDLAGSGSGGLEELQVSPRRRSDGATRRPDPAVEEAEVPAETGTRRFRSLPGLGRDRWPGPRDGLEVQPGPRDRVDGRVRRLEGERRSRRPHPSTRRGPDPGLACPADLLPRSGGVEATEQDAARSGGVRDEQEDVEAESVVGLGRVDRSSAGGFGRNRPTGRARGGDVTGAPNARRFSPRVASFEGRSRHRRGTDLSRELRNPGRRPEGFATPVGG